MLYLIMQRGLLPTLVPLASNGRFLPRKLPEAGQIIWQLEVVSMSVMFNTILAQEGIDPARVRLLRHQESKPDTIHTPYELWRDNRPGFEQYQSVQSIKNRPKFNFPIWASFVADPLGATLFVGLYSAEYIGVGKNDIPRPQALHGQSRDV